MSTRSAPRPEERSRFWDTFVRYGCNSTFRGPDLITVLLRDVVEVQSNTMVTDHLWFTKTKGFAALGELQPGDEIEFDARVQSYEKDYRGYNELKQMLNPVITDYKLSHPTKFMVVQRHRHAEDGGQ